MDESDLLASLYGERVAEPEPLPEDKKPTYQEWLLKSGRLDRFNGGSFVDTAIKLHQEYLYTVHGIAADTTQPKRPWL